MINKNIFILLSVFLFGIFSCTHETTENYVALVENIPVTEYEFTLRYNFNPYLTQYQNEAEAKRAVLSALIAEKLLALESENGSGPARDILNRIDQHKKESIIEKFRKDSVEKQVAVSQSELQKEYQNSLKEIHIQFAAFQSTEQAEKVLQQINNGQSYKNAIRRYMAAQGWNDEPIPEKIIKWNSEDYDTEKELFALEPGEVSSPLKIKGDYYLINVLSVKNTGTAGQADFVSKLPALKDRVLKEKIKSRYAEFYRKTILPVIGQVDWHKLEFAFEQIAKDISYNKNTNINHYPFEDDKSLSNEVYSNFELKQSELKNLIVVKFPDQSTWDFEKLLSVLKYGPYAFDYKDKYAFKKSFRDNVQLALEFEAIYKLACKANYQTDDSVLRDTDIWKSYYLAGDYRHQLLQHAEETEFPADSLQYSGTANFTAKQLFRLQYIDKYLQKLSEKYSIKINKEKYESLSLNKTDMVVMKSHFAHRMVVPLAEPLSGLPKWHASISSILKKFGIS
ncbi:MAG: peptidylprolyl isomerase [Calditrichaceae bacterium]